jgi:organic radical activating enzyme
MCSGLHSSSWIKSEAEFKEDHTEVKDDHKFRTVYKNWNIDYANIDKLVDCLHDVKVVEILGGEPLYDKKFRYFLEKIKKNNLLSDIKFLITTNFTCMTDDICDMLSDIKNLHIQASIDGTGKVYEWIRGHNFVDLENKLLKYLPILRKQNNFECRFNFVSTCYNIDNILEYYLWVQDLNNKTLMRIRPNFNLIARWPEYVDPVLSSKKDQSIDQIIQVKELIKNQSSGYGKIEISSTLQELDILLDHLTSNFGFNEEERWRRHHIWHAQLVKMRGFDINDIR